MDNLAIGYLFYLGPRVHSFLIKECWVDSAALSANRYATAAFLLSPEWLEYQVLLAWKSYYSGKLLGVLTASDNVLPTLEACLLEIHFPLRLPCSLT